jgi:hypothetical protein
MGIGIRLRKLWHLKAGIAVSVVLALLVGLWSIDKISVFPPGLKPRSLEMATAVTHLLIDTPSSTLIDMRQDTYSLSDLQSPAILLGNVIANGSVEASIAQRAHVPPQLLRIQAPLTPAQAAPPVDSQSARHVTDIIKSNDQYRIDIEANPTVPMLDIYAQAPSADSAAMLANSAVDELKTYMAALAVRQATPQKYQVRLVQLGRATGVVINPGVKWQLAFAIFVITLGASCAAVTFFARVRSGWREAALLERRLET